MKSSLPTRPLSSFRPCASWFASLAALLLTGLALTAPAAAQSFNASGLNGINLGNPTSLQFGPDDRLYVSQQNGALKALTVQRNGANDYAATSTETIDLVQNIPNHNDDGSSSTRSNRQVTGLYVAGTAANPVLYVSSSDPRIGAGSGNDGDSDHGDADLDTNSGIISKLTCPGGIANDACQGGWEKVDLVRGLPRSEENHATNGLQFDAANNVLLVAQGGHTNAGSPANNFARTVEYALSAAILEVDLGALDAMPTQTDSEGQQYKYDLPTLDDPSRTNESDGSDPGDPFGGNDGLNMAKLVDGGPVQIYSPGYRNPYDLVLTEGGKLYVVDNGANGGWGGYPQYEESFDCTNRYLSGEPGSTSNGPDPSSYPNDITLLPGSDSQPDPSVNNRDNLHYVPGKGFYAGHPNPVRANPVDAGLWTNGTFRDGSDASNPLPADWPAVPQSLADPVQCDYRQAGVDDGALYTWNHSTNGLTEYTASNYSGALQGNLLAAGYNGDIHRIELNSAGDDVDSEENFASSFGSQPLDVTAQGDDDVFGGTVWAATYGANNITIFEPGDYDGMDPGTCSAEDDPALDEDNDGYDNADEIDNGTDPCSGASKPADFDGDLTSDLNDPDDDNDGLSDTTDPFAIDADNGTTTSLPVEYSLFNNDPGFGFGGLGFTGLMTNGSDYLDLLDPDDDLILGGTSGLFTDPSVGEGDLYQDENSQVNAFQFGVDVDQSTAPFTVEAQINGPFNGLSGNYASQGLFIGTGDQDNYLKLVFNNLDGSPTGFQVLLEEGGTAGTGGENVQQDASGLLDASNIALYLSVDPGASTVQAKYSADGGPVTEVGGPITIPSSWLSSTDDRGLAVGFIATSFGPAAEFEATWQHLNITKDPVTAAGSWTMVSDFDEKRHENAFVQAGDKFYLLGGRESNTVKIYDPATETWSDGADAPMQLHHFQAVEKDGLIYVVGALTGGYPGEDPVENVYIYDPAADQWITGPQIPTGRLRGAGGAAFYDGKIYLAGGNVNGHNGPASTNFDAFDPATGTWTTLPDLPRGRDHFFATVAGGKLYAIGGRVSDKASGDGDVFDDTIAEVDVYDFDAGTWSTLPASANLPTPRAAPGTALLGGEIVVAGGESSQPDAHEEVEAFNPDTQTWRTLTPMRTPRHATQAIASNGGFYVAAGSGSRGGASQPQPLDGFYFFGQTSPDGSAIAASTLDAPGTLDFGSVSTGSSADDAVALGNTGGDQAIVVEGVALSGSAFSLSESFDGPVVVAPGSSLDLGVTFAPSSEGAKSGTLTVTHSGGQTLDVALEGEGGGAAAIVERINAGGSSVNATDDGPDWSADQYVTGGKTYTNDALTASDIDASASEAGPADLYLTEHSGESPFFTYDIPVPEDGPYTVKLHLAEIYFGAEGGDTGGGVGDRVFSVDIEDGQDGLSGYDIFAEVGTQTAVVETFSGISVSDGALTLDFSASTNQPKISAIEVISGSGSGNEPPTVDPIADQTHAEGDDISNAGLAVSADDPDNGPGNLAYSISGQPAGVDIEPTNGQIIGAIADGAASGSPYDVTITVSDGADQVQTGFTWTITAPPVAGEALYRVNVGGSSYDDGNNIWEADTENSYFSGGKTFGSAGSPAIAGTDDDALYQTERYGGSGQNGASPFTYSFPVSNGTYDVALRLAEVYHGVSSNGDCPVGGDCTGARLFNVDAEGQTVLTDYDIYATAGASATAVIETLSGIEVTDGTLELHFYLGENGVDNAKVSALAVFPVSAGNTAPQVAAIADQSVEESQTLNVSVSATDNEGDPITLSATIADTSGTAIDAGAYTFTDDGDGTGSLSWTPQPGDAGSYTATVTASDGTATADESFAITVTEPAGEPAVIARINAGGDSYTDTSGDAWEADTENSYFVGGEPFAAGDAGTDPNMEIAGTDDDVLYRTERSSGTNGEGFNYAIPVPAAGTYTVNLRFAEIYWGAPGGGEGGAGQRVFSANLEGGSPPELDGYDINAEVGPTTADTKSYTVDVTDGTLNIDFTVSVNQPKVSAIEVLGSSDNEPPTIAVIDDQTSTEGESVSLQVDATDPDAGDVLSYSAASLPPGLSIDSGTGLISGTIATGGQGGSAFQEQGGLVVIEAESGDALGNWQAETAISNYTGSGYLSYEGSDHFNNPGQDVIEYQVEIVNPGTYRFQWRNQAGGTSSTEENDSWLKINADSFYGEDGSGDIVCPKGYDSSQNDCSGSQPNGAGSGGWFKIYANNTNWNWQTSTSDDEPHDIFAEFGQAGTYTIQVSGRSVGHAIDRLVLHRTGPGSPDPSNPTDVSLAESPQGGGSGAAADSPYSVAVTVVDGNGGSATDNFQWTVDPAGAENTPPTLASITDQSLEEGQTLDVSVSATDADSDPITLSASNAPAFASFTDDGDGTGTLALAPQSGDAGSYDVTVTASDGQGGTASEAFTVTVTPAGAQTVVARLNAGGATGPITDGEGRTWTPDDYFGGSHGTTYSNSSVSAGDIDASATGATAAEIYVTERSSDEDLTGFNYSIPVPEAGTYIVNLHFAEIYFGAPGGKGGVPGDRVFSLDIEESAATLADYDIIEDVGTLTATVKTYSVEVTDGTLDLDFTASVNRPKVSAIEVLGGSQPPSGVPTALIEVNADTDLTSSTFGSGSFEIANNSTGSVQIQSIAFDLSSALLPDVVFDPVGAAGDEVGKCFEANSGASAVGLVTDGSGSGDGSCVDPFSQPHDGDGDSATDEGYDVMTVEFSEFDPGESFSFAVDVDPTSIKGDPGSGDAGAISGLEVAGSTITVTLSDGTTQTVVVTNLFNDGSGGGAQASVKESLPPAPTIAAQGITAPATVADASQTIDLSGGTPNASVRLLQVDARLFIEASTPNGGFDLDAFEANEAMAVQEYTATLDESGAASIDVTLLQTDPSDSPVNDGPSGGLNHFLAAVEGQGEQTSLTSNALVLEYDPNATGEATLAGTVSYGDGSALEGATLTLSGSSAPAPVTSGSDGSFSLTAATGNSYTLSASMSSDPQDASAGLTTLDLSVIKLHALGTQLIEDPLRILAADANNNESVDGGDVALGRQIILGRPDFGGNDAFVCAIAEGAFPDESDPFNYVASYSYDPLSGSQSGQDFRCAKRGDANASRTGTGSEPATVTLAGTASSARTAGGNTSNVVSGGAPLRLALGEAQVVEASGSSSGGNASEAEHEVLVPVIAPTGHASLGGYQFTLEWDAETLAFAGVEEMGLPGMSQANFFSGRALDEGLLSTVWIDPQGQAQVVEEGSQLFNVRFRVKDRSATAQSAQVRFTSSLTQIFAHDGETLEALPVEAEDGTVELEALPERFALNGNYPNPVRDQTNLSMNLPASAEVTVGVYDALGRRVMEQAEDLSAGQDQTVRLETKALSSGVYFYRVTVRLEGGEPRTETGRFVLVR